MRFKNEETVESLTSTLLTIKFIELGFYQLVIANNISDTTLYTLH